MLELIESFIHDFKNNDIQRFQEYFHNDAKVYLNTHSEGNRVICKDLREISIFFSDRFQVNPINDVIIHSRIIESSLIIDHETVQSCNNITTNIIVYRFDQSKIIEMTVFSL